MLQTLHILTVLVLNLKYLCGDDASGKIRTTKNSQFLIGALPYYTNLLPNVQLILKLFNKF